MEKETGLGELENVAVFTYPGCPEDGKPVYPDEDGYCRYIEVDDEPLIALDLSEEATTMMAWDYPDVTAGRVCYKRMSAEAKRFLLTHTSVGEEIAFEMYQEMENLRNKDWVLQDYDSYEEWARTHDILGDPVPDLCPEDGPPLNLEFPEVYDGWHGWKKPVFLGGDEIWDLKEHVYGELQNLLNKYSLFPIDDHSKLIYIFSGLST